jgi:hypothetical protein
MSVGWQPQRPMTADRKRSPDRGYSPQNCSSRQVATIDTKHVEASPEKVTHHVKKGDPDKSWWLWVVSTASVYWLTPCTKRIIETGARQSGRSVSRNCSSQSLTG